MALLRFLSWSLWIATMAGAVASCGSAAAGKPLDAGTDSAPPPCPAASVESGSACASPGQLCEYANGTPLGLGCYCIGPEKVWMCCAQAFACGSDPTHPNITVGAPCCPGDTQPGASYACGWCFNTDVALELTCAVDDPHWRQSEKPCSSPFFDAGPEGG